MHTPKVIIHRLDAPWLRESRTHRRRMQRGLLVIAGAAAGFAVLIGTLRAADQSDSVLRVAAPRHSFTENNITQTPNTTP